MIIGRRVFDLTGRLAAAVGRPPSAAEAMEDVHSGGYFRVGSEPTALATGCAAAGRQTGA